MKKTIKIVLLALILIAAIRQFVLRLAYEAGNTNVEVCVELKQINEICARENYKKENLLDRLKTMGVTSVVLDEETVESLNESGNVVYFTKADIEKYKLLGLVSPEAPIMPETFVVKSKELAKYFKNIIKEKYNEDPETVNTGNYTIFKLKGKAREAGWGYLKQNIDLLKKYGLDCILRPGKDFAILQILPENFSSVIVTEDFKPALINEAAQRNMRLVLTESSKEEQLFRSALAVIPCNVIRAHRINQPGLNTTEVISRFLRAVKERNCRVIYYDFNKNLTLEQNLDILRETCVKFDNSGFTLNQAKMNKYLYFLPAFAGKLLALLLALFLPVYIMCFIIKRQINEGSKDLKEASMVFFKVSGFTLLGTLLMSVLISNTEFLIRLNMFKGVKLAMAVPIIVTVFCLFDYEEIKAFMHKHLNLGNLIVIVSIVLFFVYMLIRSGNTPEISVAESKTRYFLEDVFGVRPRFKEIIGHPLFLLGVVLNSRVLLVLGLIGQISIINTFMHSHTPLYLSLLRVIYGLIIGYSAGVIAVYFTNKYIHAVENK
ncbi:MAG: hypothetical protein A2252_11070 [Elusimicrobia bacterium RIFOXYA2_FULL_39_19]|nr:MAG: hypothetical protein A2252_11070 [Elusimicrobia bacterium RIFOXYA2_FULL_39_19]